MPRGCRHPVVRVFGVMLATGLLGAAPVEPREGASDDAKMLREVIARRIAGEDVAADRLGEPVRRWLAANQPALAGVRRGGLSEQPWGLSSSDGSGRLYLYVFDWHASGRLVVYGLTGGVGKAYLFADSAHKPLEMTRFGSASTAITVPKDPPDSLATVVVLELSGKLETMQTAVRPGADGRILMHARDAVIHGKKVRYEPEPHKDTIGYWSDPADWVSWDFEVTEPGTYSVEILQGCGKGSGGSTVRFVVGEQALPVTVEDTGGFQNFVTRNIGELTFPKPGRHTLEVRPVMKAKNAVMDLRSVTLTRRKPAG